ncbi:MAG: M23 family metallopeptidase [Firmicutes bacterium]|nr:M23 family metallopeptidase [Bacillota bacterium]
MDELLIIKKFFPIIIPFASLLFIVSLILMISTSSSGDATILAGTLFRKPFNDDVNYSVTSYFGNRLDPFGSGEITNHYGIDLSAPEGTDIVAIGDGIVYQVGNDSDGLGNYVYIKHDYGDIIFYSIYGHMLDDSIVVNENQNIKSGEKIGCVGNTGSSTGNHLHLALTSPILEFNDKYYVDPYYVIEGL